MGWAARAFVLLTRISRAGRWCTPPPPDKRGKWMNTTLAGMDVTSRPVPLMGAQGIVPLMRQSKA